MKFVFGTFFFAILLAVSVSCKNSKSNKTGNHTIYLVRHAEKGDDGTKDPPLTGEGIRRAEKLADMLKFKKVEKIYSTDFIRTKETAKALAHRQEMEILIYDPNDPSFVKKLKNDLQDQSVLVVGHSNSTPTLVNSIIGEDQFEKLDESNYETIFEIKYKDGRYLAEKKSF